MVSHTPEQRQAHIPLVFVNEFLVDFMYRLAVHTSGHHHVVLPAQAGINPNRGAGGGGSIRGGGGGGIKKDD